MITLANILHHKNVTNKIPQNFKDKSVPVISYSYTLPIASKIVNYKRLLQNLEIENFKAKPSDCSCKNSPFKYGPSGPVVTGDLTIIENEFLRNILFKAPRTTLHKLEL